MGMRISNQSDDAALFWWSSRNSEGNLLDVVVFRGDVPVWSAMAAHELGGEGNELLSPGESITLGQMFGGFGEPWTWDTHGDCGGGRFGGGRYQRCDDPVSPGAYTVRGVVNVSPPGTPADVYYRDAKVIAVTTEQPLVITAP